jgi:hypothetical protein
VGECRLEDRVRLREGICLKFGTEPCHFNGSFIHRRVGVDAAIHDTAMHGKAHDAARALVHHDDGRPLVGDRFWQDWGEDRLSSLFRVMQDTMPRARPHSLEEGTYVDIVSFILQENGFPAGSRELTSASTRDIQVTREEGPGPVPNFSLIAVVGCLARSVATTWSVHRASVPARTRNPDPSQDEERGRAGETPLADNTFELMDAGTAATGHEGRRAEVKGLLIRGSPDKINITSIQVLDGPCDR